MFRRSCIAFILLVIFSVIAIGCSAAGPVAPGTDERSGIHEESHSLWGLWQFSIDRDSEKLDFIPIRDADMHLNALRFLEPPPSLYLTVEGLQFNGDEVTVDIGLRHPFLGLQQFTGFDVCGIFITSGSVSGFDDAGLVMTGDGDTRILNPDGYTRWWNPVEFPVNEGTMFSYNDGLLGTPHSQAAYNCTLNAYKYFTDGLDPSEGLESVDPSTRGIFSAGQKNVRRYVIKMAGGLVFNYAIDANWEFPQGSPPWDVPDDFDEGANRPEAWNISVTETANTLWNDGVSSGGELSISIDVYDHFDADLNSVRVESPGNFVMATSGAPTGGGYGYSTYEVDITGATPSPGSIDLLITVECEKSGYRGLLPDVQQAVYFTHSVDVTGESPSGGIYVDGDNVGDPLEDGTMAHPFDDIMDGIYAAGNPPYEDVFDVYVDPYDDGQTKYPYFKMKNFCYLHGDSWNGGPGKPLIDANSQYGIVGDMDGVLIEGFEFHINNPLNTETSYCIQMWDSDNVTIKDCKFTGFARGRYTHFLYVSNCKNLTLEHNEFAGLRNRYDVEGDPADTPWDGHVLYVVNLDSCPGYVVKQNEFHDFGYDDEGDSTTYAWTITYMLRMFDCHDSFFTNNLVYDFNDYSKADPVGDPLQYTKNHAHLVYWGSTYPDNTLNFTFANNTFDDLSVTGGDSSVNAQGSATYGSRPDSNWVMKNSICSNMHDLTTVPQVNWHRGFWSDGPGGEVTMDYSCCYNYGSPGSGVTVGGFVNYINRGTGCFELADNQDPAYDMMVGDNWYHVTNPVLLSDDGSEMGAFGGPEGDWTPPSQE